MFWTCKRKSERAALEEAIADYERRIRERVPIEHENVRVAILQTQSVMFLEGSINRGSRSTRWLSLALVIATLLIGIPAWVENWPAIKAWWAAL